MKAVRLLEYGGQLVFNDVPTPTIALDEILGGNSAGQAAMFLSTIAKHVYMLVRASGLADSMSQYLIRRIQECREITLLFRTEIVRLEGTRSLESVTWRNRDTGETEMRPSGISFP